jgi:transcriptional regulator
MYIPPHNGPPSTDDVTRLLLETRAGDLVTVGDDGLTVSMIPFLFDPSVGHHGTLLGHLARPNTQWRGADGREALVLLHGPDGVRESGLVCREARARSGGPDVELRARRRPRVAPGPRRSGMDARRRRAADAGPRGGSDGAVGSVGRARALHRGPAQGDRGIEVEIDRVEAKWKLSQNRSAADVAGVIDGLGAGTDDDLTLADAMSVVEAGRSDRRR